MTEWGSTYFERANISPDMQAKIDKEVAKIMDDCYKRAVVILRRLRAKLDKVASELLAKETIEGEDFEKIMGYPKRTLNPQKN